MRIRAPQSPRFLVRLTCTVFCLRSAAACNGSPDFCELPLDWFTFPGSHNSGAFGLDASADISNAAGVLGGVVTQCYYNNHGAGFDTQLAAGVRWFNTDLCTKDGTASGTVYNCHGPSTSMMSYGQPWSDSLQEIKAFLTGNPNEIVVFHMSDADPNALKSGGAVEASIESVFGSCLDMDMNNDPGGNAPRCMFWGNRPVQVENMTLGKLVTTKRQLLIVNTFYDGNLGHPSVQNTWTAGGVYKAPPNDVLYNHIHDFVNGLETQDRRHWIAGNASQNILSLDIFASTDFPTAEEVKSLAFSQFDLSCIVTIANRLNEFFFAGDSTDEKYYTQTNNCGDSVTGQCLGYKTKIEVDHQRLLDKEQVLASILIDYVHSGRFVDTTKRINEANWRRYKGLNELEIPWYAYVWVQVLFGLAGALCFISFAGSLLTLAFRPWWCPKRIQKQCRCMALEKDPNKKKHKHKHHHHKKDGEDAEAQTGQVAGAVAYGSPTQAGGWQQSSPATYGYPPGNPGAPTQAGGWQQSSPATYGYTPGNPGGCSYPPSAGGMQQAYAPIQVGAQPYGMNARGTE